MIEWDEPYDSECKINVTLRMAKEDAITLQKNHAKKVRGYIYNSDIEALNDFMVVHWAREVISEDS